MAGKPVQFSADVLKQDLPHAIAFLRVWVRTFPGRLDDDTPEELEKLLASPLGLEMLAERFNGPAQPPGR
jgi:hypothetical protein